MTMRNPCPPWRRQTITKLLSLCLCVCTMSSPGYADQAQRATFDNAQPSEVFHTQRTGTGPAQGGTGGSSGWSCVSRNALL